MSILIHYLSSYPPSKRPFINKSTVVWCFCKDGLNILDTKHEELINLSACNFIQFSSNLLAQCPLFSENIKISQQTVTTVWHDDIRELRWCKCMLFFEQIPSPWFNCTLEMFLQTKYIFFCLNCVIFTNQKLKLRKHGNIHENMKNC